MFADGLANPTGHMSGATAAPQNPSSQHRLNARALCVDVATYQAFSALSCLN